MPSEGKAAASEAPAKRSRGSKIVGNLVMALALGISSLMFVPAILGYHRYVILTGSMTGTYDRGSIVYDKPVPTDSLKVGDPITYAPPPGASPHKLVTHRIWKITRDQHGNRVFRTKGDANKAPDTWKFMLNQPTQDKVFFHIPYMGFVFMVLSIKQFRMVLIGLPAILLALGVLVHLWKEAGEVARREEEGWTVGESTELRTLPPLPEGVEVSAPRPVFVPVPSVAGVPAHRGFHLRALPAA